MNFGNAAIFELSKAKMSYLGQNQAVLAQNVANVDTPGYRAKDVQMPDFSGMLEGRRIQSTALARTHQGHMEANGLRGNFPIIEREIVDENNPNENGVNIDTEVQKVAFTQAEYEKVIAIYRKQLSFARIAIGNPNA